MFTRSHTYLDSYSERDLSPIISAQSTGARGKVQNEQQYSIGQTLTEVEHDYDEVTREEEPIILQHSSSFSGSNEVTEECQNYHHNLQHDLEELHEADLEVNEDGTTSTPDSVVRESENEEDIYGDGDEFERQGDFSTTNTGDLQSDSHLFLEGLVDSSTCSSVVVLPHLNSEDRLNNNSSLDTLLTSSILVKPNCSLDYLEDSVEPGKN